MCWINAAVPRDVCAAVISCSWWSREEIWGKCWSAAAALLFDTELSPIHPLRPNAASPFIVFHLPVGLFLSLHEVSAALLPFPSPLGERASIPSHWEDKCLGTKSATLQAMYIYLHLCGILLISLVCEWPHVYMTTPCFCPTSLFHHTRIHTYMQTDVSLTALVMAVYKDSLRPSSITHQYWRGLSTLTINT